MLEKSLWQGISIILRTCKRTWTDIWYQTYWARHLSSYIVETRFKRSHICNWYLNWGWISQLFLYVVYVFFRTDWTTWKELFWLSMTRNNCPYLKLLQICVVIYVCSRFPGFSCISFQFHHNFFSQFPGPSFSPLNLFLAQYAVGGFLDKCYSCIVFSSSVKTFAESSASRVLFLDVCCTVQQVYSLRVLLSVLLMLLWL